MREKRLWLFVLALVLVLLGSTALYIATKYWERLKLSETVAQGAFAGIVVDGLSDRPLAFARIMAVDAGSLALRVETQSDERGRFHLDLPDGKYWLRAEAKGYALRGQNDRGRLVELERQTRFVNAKLKLWPLATIRGRLSQGGSAAELELSYDYDASGAENFVLTRFESRSDGQFSFDAAYAGLAELSISVPGFATQRLSGLELGFGQVLDLGEIPLERGCSVYGRVLDAQTGRAISNAELRLRAEHARRQLAVEGFDNGDYRLPALSANRAELWVSAPGYRSQSLWLDLKACLNLERDFRLRRNWGLFLEIDNAQGLGPTRIEVRDLEGKLVYEGVHENGPLSLEQLKAGQYQLTAISADGEDSLQWQLQAGDSLDVLLKKRPSLILRLYVKDFVLDGETRVRYHYRARREDPSQASPWYSFEGQEHRFEGLKKGYYQVELVLPNAPLGLSETFYLGLGDSRALHYDVDALLKQQVEPESIPLSPVYRQLEREGALSRDGETGHEGLDVIEDGSEYLERRAEFPTVEPQETMASGGEEAAAGAAVQGEGAEEQTESEFKEPEEVVLPEPRLNVANRRRVRPSKLRSRSVEQVKRRLRSRAMQTRD